MAHQAHSELQTLVRGPHSDAKASINPFSGYMEMAQHPVLADAQASDAEPNVSSCKACRTQMQASKQASKQASRAGRRPGA